MKSDIVTNEQLKAMKKALKAVPVFKLESTKTSLVVTLPDGKEIFRAMRGSSKVGGTWLIRHVENLFE